MSAMLVMEALSIEMLRALAILTGFSLRGLKLAMYSYMACLMASVTSIVRAMSKKMLRRFAIATYSTRSSASTRLVDGPSIVVCFYSLIWEINSICFIGCKIFLLVELNFFWVCYCRLSR